MAYLGKTPSQAVRSRYYFTASGGETSLSPSEVTSLSFTDANYVDVSLNGVALVSGTDYTATPSTNTISGLAALTASDVVEIVVYDTFSVFGGNVNGDFNISGGNLTLSDNDKAIFGAGSDLQIYHDGSNSYVADKGTGNLVLQADASFKLENADATKTSIFAQPAGAVQLKYDNNTKLATTATGIDVNGTVTADGLTVDSDSATATIKAFQPKFILDDDSAVGAGSDKLIIQSAASQSDGDYEFVLNNDQTSSADRTAMKIKGNGDVSLYADDGTTQSFFWDASAQSLGLGTTGPSKKLHLYAENDAASVRFQNTANSKVWEITPSIPGVANSGLSIVNVTDNTVPLHIDNSGNVGIGETSPLGTVHIRTSDASITSVNGNADDLIVENNGNCGISIASSPSGEGNLNFIDSGDTNVGRIQYTHSNNNMVFRTGDSERMRIDGSGNLLVGKTTQDTTTDGFQYRGDNDEVAMTRTNNPPLVINRLNNDGTLIVFRQQNTDEGSISVSGTTVSYNGGHLARWSQLADNTKDTSIVKGTVMTNLDQMAEWTKDGVTEDNEQLNCMAVSSVEGDANVAGVFVNWDDDDTDFTADMNIAMTGDMVIRIAQGTTVARGDLLMSAGDGTAKPQGDDIVRSKTIAKVTSTNVSHTYDDGSYLVPCVLMAC